MTPYGGHVGYEAGGGNDSHAVSSSVHSNSSNILQRFKHEDVVAALLTQLREKQSELVKSQRNHQLQLREKQSELVKIQHKHQLLEQQHFVTGQVNKEMKRKMDQCAEALIDKDERIDVLEQSVLHEREEGKAILNLKLGALQKSYDSCKCTLDKRNQELDALRPRAEELASKVEEYEQSTSLEKAKALEQKLASTTGRLETCTERMEELEKQNKSKDWVIKSLKDEVEANRTSERQLQCEVETLKTSVTAYEAEFKGTSVDVPLLIAKLADSEIRTKDLQSQIRRLTNKKLTELVLRSSPNPDKMKGSSRDDTTSTNRDRAISRRRNSSGAPVGKTPGTPVALTEHESVSNEEFSCNSSLDDIESIDSDPFSPNNEAEEEIMSDFNFCCTKAAESEEDKQLSPPSTSTRR